jgi:hypothetical protein
MTDWQTSLRTAGYDGEITAQDLLDACRALISRLEDRNPHETLARFKLWLKNACFDGQDLTRTIAELWLQLNRADQWDWRRS